MTNLHEDEMRTTNRQIQKAIKICELDVNINCSKSFMHLVYKALHDLLYYKQENTELRTQLREVIEALELYNAHEAKHKDEK